MKQNSEKYSVANPSSVTSSEVVCEIETKGHNWQVTAVQPTTQVSPDLQTVPFLSISIDQQ
jgi:hypothetical protein